MRVLVIGNGGREHALRWKLGQSSSVKVSEAPGGLSPRDYVALVQDVDVEPGQTATLAMPGPEPNHGCAVFSGLYYVGLNVGLVAMAVLTLGLAEKQHVGFK